jgi:hypothetical protein
MPFENESQNFMEIFNEVCVMLITYVYMYFKQSFEPNYIIGIAFKSIYIMNFAVNLLKVMWFLTFTICPDLYKLFKKKRDDHYKIENPRLEYFQKILKMHTENPDCPIALAYYKDSLELFKVEENIITSELYCLNLGNLQK